MKSKESWIVGSILVLFLVPVIFIIGIVIGINLSSTYALSQDNLSSWVTAFATVVIAVLTIVLAKETWALRINQLSQIEQIRKDAIRPSVTAYLERNPAAFNFYDVHVYNNGPGIARNIRFEFNNATPDCSDVYEDVVSQLKSLSIFDKGISSLSPLERKTSYILSFIEMHQKFKDRVMESSTEVIIDFEDIEGSPYRTSVYFDFRELKGISQLGGGDPLHRIAKHLEKLQEQLGNLTSGYRRVKMDIYSSEDRRVEAKEWEAQREEFRNRNGAGS